MTTPINNTGGGAQITNAMANWDKAEKADRQMFDDGARKDDNGVKVWTQDTFTRVSSAADEKKKYTVADFQKADANHDGKLTEEEFMNFRGMDRVFKQGNENFSNYLMGRIMSKLGDALRGR